MDRKCHWKGCDSGARWGCRVHLECQGTDERRLLKFHSTIECCDEHQANVKPWVLSDQNREIITTLLMERGYAEPNFLTANIEFLPIGHEPLMVIEPCNRSGCAKPAQWRIVQVIPHITGAEKAAKLTTNLCVCDEHRQETKAADLLDPASKAATHAFLKRHNLSMRSLNRMRLEFEPLTGGQNAMAG